MRKIGLKEHTLKIEGEMLCSQNLLALARGALQGVVVSQGLDVNELDPDEMEDLELQSVAFLMATAGMMLVTKGADLSTSVSMFEDIMGKQEEMLEEGVGVFGELREAIMAYEKEELRKMDA